mgnify:CR=1 FL=1
MSPKYTNPTGAGYVATHRVSGGTVSINITALRDDLDEFAYVYRSERDTVVLSPDADVDLPGVAYARVLDSGYVSVCSEAVDILDADDEQDVRVYEHRVGYEIVPSTADPHVGRER